MNLKTRLVLLIVAVAGGLIFWLGPSLTPLLAPGQVAGPASADAEDSETQTILAREFTPQSLSGITLKPNSGELIELNRNGNKWTLPGDWPTREHEVNQLI